jgi:hypothetical protein
MKKILALALALSVASSQAFSYDLENLRDLESATAAAETATVVMEAFVGGPVSPTMSSIGNVSHVVNNLAAYALQDQSFVMHITRVIKQLATDARWQGANINEAYFKNFGMVLSKAVSMEVGRYLGGLALGNTVSAVTDNRIINRAADAVTASIVTATLETLFARLNHMVQGAAGAVAPGCSATFMAAFRDTLVMELAYNAAGEMIRQGAAGSKVDYIADLKSVMCCDDNS